MKRLVPINWSILRERVGTCLKCGKQNVFKFWNQKFPFPYLECVFCFWELCIDGAVKDLFREEPMLPLINPGNFEKVRKLLEIKEKYLA